MAEQTEAAKKVLRRTTSRRKSAEAQHAALEDIRALARQVPAVLERMLLDDSTPPTNRIRIIEMILERTFGKAEAAVRTEKAGPDVLADIRQELEQLQQAEDASQERSGEAP